MTITSENPPRLFESLEKHRWRKVRRMLKSAEGLELCKEKDSTGLSCLGIALGFQAPVDVIKLMISVNPELIDYRDSFGAGCLHVACLNGSSIEAIDYLLQNYPILITARDNDDRIPLHHAVEFACQCLDEEDEDFCLDLIEKLYKSKPETIHYSDKARDSPTDLIQLFRMTSDHSDHQRLDAIYHLTRQFSTDYYKSKKKKWEEQGYDTTVLIERKFEKVSLDKQTITTDGSSKSKHSVYSKVSAAVAENGSVIDTRYQPI